MTNEHTSLADLVASARGALQRGQVVDAVRLYRLCLERGAPVVSELAGACYQMGDFAAARDVLDAAISRAPEHDDWFFQRGLVLMAMGEPGRAEVDFDRFLEASPGFAPACFQRALARVRLHRLGDALEDFRQATRLQPDMVDAWLNMGILLLRTGEAQDAVDALRAAEQRAPGRQEILRALASAYDGAGDVPSALQLYARLEPTSASAPDFLTNHALCLLRGGQPEAAHQRFTRALGLAARDQTALAGLYIAANELGRHHEVDALMDFARLLHATTSRLLPDDRQALQQAVIAHPELNWEPAGRSTVHGQQSVMLDLAAGSPFHAIGEAMSQEVTRHMAALAAQPALARHPWVRSAPSRWRLQMWATVLQDGGHQTPHIHPAGWMSGVFYLNAGQPVEQDAGDIVFGHPQPEFAPAAPPRSARHHPRSGDVLLFPSYFFHHTVPYHGAAERISLAFDVIPA
jgi:tetratricopeptide (TPR) repeat protein